MPETMAERMTRLRRSLRPRLTQAEAAMKVGVSRETWGQWERGGIVRPYRQHLSKIAEVLQTTVEYLLNGNTDELLGNESGPTPTRPIHKESHPSGDTIGFIRRQEEHIDLQPIETEGTVLVEIRMHPKLERRLFRYASAAGMSVADYLERLMEYGQQIFRLRHKGEEDDD